MPPYKRRFVKKRYARSRSVSRRRPLGNSFMKRARTRAYANIQQSGLLAIERKFCDYAAGPVDLTTGGAGVATGEESDWSPGLVGPTMFRSAIGFVSTCAPVALNVVGPGDSGSNRDGRQVINDSIHLRGLVEYKDNFNWTFVNPFCLVNIAIVLDTQTNGGAPTGSKVFVNPGDLAASTVDCGCSPFVNLANSKRFRILKHIRRYLPVTTSGDGTVTRAAGAFAWAADIPLKQMKTNYVTDSLVPGATSASIGDNGIFLFAWTNVPGTSPISMSYTSRLRFRG